MPVKFGPSIDNIPALHADAYRNVSSLPEIKKKTIECLADIEDAIAGAIGYEEFMERERVRPL